MSIRVQTYVWQLELSPSEKLVALAMADHCHDDGGEARPSRATIAKKCGFSERQVIRHIQKLVSLGVIVLDRAATHYRTNVYRFILPDDFGVVKSGAKAVTNPVDSADSGVTSKVNPHDSGVTSEVRGVTSTVRGVTPEVSRGDMGVTLTIREPSIEPSLETSSSSDDDGQQGETVETPKPKPFADEFAQIWEVYPRRVGRGAAYTQFVARLRAGVPFEELMEATLNYAETRRGQPNEYTKHGSTFFGASEHWKDFLASGAAIAETQEARKPAIFAALTRFLEKD